MTYVFKFMCRFYPFIIFIRVILKYYCGMKMSLKLLSLDFDFIIDFPLLWFLIQFRLPIFIL